VKTLSPDRIKAFAKFWLVEAIRHRIPDIRQMSSSSVIVVVV